MIGFICDNQNQVEALYLKGICHFYGKNQFEQNIDLGIQLLEQAAQQNYQLAQRELGRIYDQHTLALKMTMQH